MQRPLASLAALVLGLLLGCHAPALQGPEAAAPAGALDVYDAETGRYHNARYGFVVVAPPALFGPPRRAADGSGAVFLSKDSTAVLRVFARPAEDGSLQRARADAERETPLRRTVTQAPGAFTVRGESPARYVFVRATLRDSLLLTLDLRYARSRHARFGPAVEPILASFPAP